MTTSEPSASEQPLSDDILDGASAIAKFMFGSVDNRQRRRIYHLIKSAELPTFKLGGSICIRKTTLREWIADREKTAAREKIAARERT